MKKHMKYQAAIFDLDGTILNTLEDLTDSINFALQKNGYPQRTIEEVRRFVGNGIGKLAQRAVPAGTGAEQTKQVLDDFKEYYGKHCADKTLPYEGITDLLKELRASGCRIAVVSNKADFAVQTLCKDYFPDLFDVAVGEREGIRRKPSPDALFEILDKLGIHKEQAVYIGDSEVDIETAANAGMDCLSVDWGFRSTDFLKQQGAKKIVSTMKELQDCILVTI